MKESFTSFIQVMGNDKLMNMIKESSKIRDKNIE
jgi:hypothetical protein